MTKIVREKFVCEKCHKKTYDYPRFRLAKKICQDCFGGKK